MGRDKSAREARIDLARVERCLRDLQAEFAPTDKIFTNPDDRRTEDYVTGKVG